MQELRYTLLADGSSDRAHRPILTWMLRRVLRCNWYRGGVCRLASPASILPKNFLSAFIGASSCIHAIRVLVLRDAESAPIEKREAEIRKALEESSVADSVRVVCVVPVRMQEAWLLIDEAALRNAAGDPNGTQPLDMPDVQKLEELADPKQLSRELLRLADAAFEGVA